MKGIIVNIEKDTVKEIRDNGQAQGIERCNDHQYHDKPVDQGPDDL